MPFIRPLASTGAKVYLLLLLTHATCIDQRSKAAVEGREALRAESGGGETQETARTWATGFPAGGFVDPLPPRWRHRGRGAPDQRLGALEDGYPPDIYRPSMGNTKVMDHPNPPPDPPPPPIYKRSHYLPYTSADVRDYSKTGGLVKKPCKASLPMPIITKLSVPSWDQLPSCGRLTIWGDNLAKNSIRDVLHVEVNGRKCIDVQLGVAKYVSQGYQGGGAEGRGGGMGCGDYIGSCGGIIGRQLLGHCHWYGILP